MKMTTKIGKAISAFIQLLNNACSMREVWAAKRQAFMCLEKAEKRMSFRNVCEMNIMIFEAMDNANARVNSCNAFSVIYSKGVKHA